MPAVQAPAIVRPLRLWKATLVDITPGWGLSHECYFLSSRKPRRGDVLGKVDWQDALKVHPGDLAVESYEDTKITVEVDPATTEQAKEMLTTKTTVHILRETGHHKEAA